MKRHYLAFFLLFWGIQSTIYSQGGRDSLDSSRDSKECRYGIQVPLQGGDTRRSELAFGSYDLNPATNPDIYNMQKLMDANQQSFEFINVAISNLWPPDSDPKKALEEADRMEQEGDKSHDKKQYDSLYFYDFRRASSKQLEGSIYYFKGDYNASAQPLRESQRLLKDIFEDVSERHNEYTRVLLTYAANRIIPSKDNNAKYFLKLAFRELKNAEINYCMGWNSAPAQYRKKIWHFEEGIRSSRKSRRLALIALMDYNTPKDEKRAYKKEKLNEYKDPSYDGSVNSYEYLKKSLRNYIENKWIEPQITSKIAFQKPMTNKEINYEAKPDPINLMEVLDDCYGIITYKRMSIFEITKQYLRKEQAVDEAITDPAPTPAKETTPPNKN
jgi:hypothetical protein